MTSTNPYLISGPALISYSGGRTSGFMLKKIADAYEGCLPDNLVTAFSDTGKEREETLRFVYECGQRWGIPIVWLEWRPTPEQAQAAADRGDEIAPWMLENATPEKFAIVGYNSASRDGEPFRGIIATRQLLPNVTMRYCTSKLKVDVMRRLMLSRGFERWNNAVGLRYDEGHRVLKQLARNDAGRERYTAVMPMASAKVKVTQQDVLRFWLGETGRLEDGVRPQGFDLELQSYEGNCDLCFLKKQSTLKALMRDRPGCEEWWIRREAENAGRTRDPRMARFNKDFSFAGLADEVRSQPFMPGLDDEEFDAECGLTCTGDEI